MNGSDSLITSYRAGIVSRSAALIDSTPPDRPYDFLDVLAITQRLNIDFLPITWQPALDSIGEGATAEIRQSLIDLQMSFAFKRFKMNEFDIFRSVISEVLVLGHSSLREHPNILSLQGVCWDISPDQKVWPVLVFEKAQMGNLESFMDSDTGKLLPIKDKLKICSGIAAAVREMHLHGMQRSCVVRVF